jgi:hypothetical protein
MARGADIEPDFLFRGLGLKAVAAGARDLRRLVLGVYTFLHILTPFIACLFSASAAYPPSLVGNVRLCTRPPRSVVCTAATKKSCAILAVFRNMICSFFTRLRECFYYTQKMARIQLFFAGAYRIAYRRRR